MHHPPDWPANEASATGIKMNDVNEEANLLFRERVE